MRKIMLLLVFSGLPTACFAQLAVGDIDTETCQWRVTNWGTASKQRCDEAKALEARSATGCIKLGFFASTPRSSEFRTWASKVLAARQTGVDVAVLDLARENGDLKDMVRARDEIIRAKDGAIMGLQGQLIGSLLGQNRLLKRVDSLQKSTAAREARQLIIRMEAEGKPRSEIVELSGRTLNHVRQVIWQARRDGKLPQEGGAA